MFEFLNKPVSSKALGVFRIIFGFLLIFQFTKIKKRIPFFKDPDYLYFPFPELDWIPVFSSELMTIFWGVGLFAVVLVIVGFFFRYASILAGIIYGYFFSLDAVYYNNHYYLIFLICILLSFTSADRSYSLSSFKKTKKGIVPNWQYFIFQLQIGIVFFYGGISKLSRDWFDGNIVRGITESDFLNQFIIYGGTVFDILIPFALFFKRTRLAAIILVILFNVSNHFLFDDIASFPILVMASMLLFIADISKPKFFSNWLKVSSQSKEVYSISLTIKILLGCFFVFQFLYPLRHYVIPGHVDWTGQGHYFAWRMKSYHKDIKLDFYAFDKAKGQRAYKINHGIDDYRIQRIASMPHMIPVIATNIRKKIEKQDGFNQNLGISSDYMVSFNHRTQRLGINPNIDISSMRFKKYTINNWITELK